MPLTSILKHLDTFPFYMVIYGIQTLYFDGEES